MISITQQKWFLPVSDDIVWNQAETATKKEPPTKKSCHFLPYVGHAWRNGKPSGYIGKNPEAARPFMSREVSTYIPRNAPKRGETGPFCSPVLRMAFFRSEFVELGRQDVRIHVTLSETAATAHVPAKTAPTVVFLHYWGGSTRTWAQVASRIARAGTSAGYRTAYRTLSIDFRGWGLSTGPADAAAYSISALADDVRDVLAQLRRNGALAGGRIVLVGLSMGAKVAQVVAARLVEKGVDSGDLLSVSGVVLVSPAPVTALQLPPNMQEQQLHAYDSAESASFVARNVLTESFRGGGGGGGYPELPENLVEDMLRGNPSARAAWPAYAMAEDVSATSISSLANTSSSLPPVLVLAAEKDVVEPLERVRSGVQGRIPGAQLEVVAGSGHLSPIDAPEAVADSIVRFMDTITEGELS